MLEWISNLAAWEVGIFIASLLILISAAFTQWAMRGWPSDPWEEAQRKLKRDDQER